MDVPVRTRHRRRRRAAPRTRGGAVLALGLLLTVIVGSALVTGSAVVLSTYNGIASDLPDNPSATILQGQSLGPARIFDRNGTLLYEFEDENAGLRDPIRLREMSPFVLKATIATEDNSFYDNPGVNVRGLARAAVENFLDADTGLLQGSGGSSITQQLSKNVFIEAEDRYERSVDRKLRETVFALELTKRYSKEQILEWYLNQISYGNRANGIGAAARRYFNVRASDLTLAQAALLAGLPQSPARYDPYRYRDAAIARQHEVLDLMARHSYITEEEAAAAKEEPLTFATNNVTLLAPHWVFYVRDQLIARFGLDTFRGGGLQVTTTLDLPLQQKAEQIMEEKIAYYESPKGGNCQCRNGALVAIDNNTGEILTMVGSRDYWRPDIEGENNNAIAIKQPGSAFKPVVYLAAFEKGWNPGTLISDAPTRFLSRIDGNRREYFTPEGPLKYWAGNLSARASLGNSMNTAAVKTAGFVGVNGVIEMAHRVGITSLNEQNVYGVSIATGGSNLTLLDLAYAYSVIANNGEMRGMRVANPQPNLRRLEPVSLRRVVDGNGKVLLDFTGPEREQVVQAGYAYQITDILQDNDAKRLTYNAPEYQFGMPDKRPVAAKTGTQQGPEKINSVLSTWNFGYVPDLTVGVWVGNADNSLVNPNLTSASSSLLIWKEFLAAAVSMLNIPAKTFPVPPDIEWQTVNGKREPLVKGVPIVRAEDPKLWAVFAGNPTPVPTATRAAPAPQSAAPAHSSQPAPAAPTAAAPIRPAATPPPAPVATPAPVPSAVAPAAPAATSQPPPRP